jgi:hypothetical protein
MKLEILYFGGCPSYLKAENTLREVLAQEAIEAEVELVVVNSDEAAQRLGFPGSPTIRADGEDLFPMPTRSAYALGCRMYTTPEGLRGSPTAKMVWEALANFLERRKDEVSGDGSSTPSPRCRRAPRFSLQSAWPSPAVQTPTPQARRAWSART